MSATTKLVTDDDLAAIESQRESAELVESELKDAWSMVAGKAILQEASDSEVAEAAAALAMATDRTAALYAAQGLVGARLEAQNAASEDQRVKRLRAESDKAKEAEDAAIAQVADAADLLTQALEVADAQATLLRSLNDQLTLSDHDRALEVDADLAATVADITADAGRRKASVMEAASQARYALQRSDGQDPALGSDLVLLGAVIAPQGKLASEALALVMDWQLSALAAMEDQWHEAVEQAHGAHAGRLEKAGLGRLPGREMPSLDDQVIARLLPVKTKRALASLAEFLPASALSGVSFRAAPKSALEARQIEDRLTEGRKAIEALINLAPI